MTCGLMPACTDTSLEPTLDRSPQFAKGGGNGRGGGNGGGTGETRLSVVLAPGTVTTDGGGAYVHGIDGMDPVIKSGGWLGFHLADGDGRQIFIGEIRDSGGNLLLAETGLTAAQVLTKGCCDLRAMTADSAGIQLSGPSIPVKLNIGWGFSGASYNIAMGSTNGCIGGSTPDNDPVRGTWARATQAIVGADTTWTIESVGPASLCRFINRKGNKNDERLLMTTDAVVELSMVLSTVG